MRKGIIIIMVCFGLYPLSASAVTYDRTGSTTSQEVQMRVGADFTKKWNNGIHLHFGEEIRGTVYDHISGSDAKGNSVDSTASPYFSRAYTTIGLSYKHPEFSYLGVEGGYVLKMYGNKGWSNVNEWLRHRVYMGVTASYRVNAILKLTLRERFLMEARTDSVNPLEKNKIDWLMRSRLGLHFSVPGKPVKPYLWVELENTLNAPEYQQKDGHQYLSQVRTAAGVKWVLTKRSALDFYYRFYYGYDRDINITKKNNYIELTENKGFTHMIGVVYNFDW